ncbi:MAG: Lacal_2735 family protein [Crocinitomicaceae bacterium]|nr:Lacal_2735 family protein [Crocinitomicaceae bacterium]
MFEFLKKKSPLEKLDKEHKKLLEEAFQLSKSNRSESDKKYKEADDLAIQIEQLKAKQ